MTCSASIKRALRSNPPLIPKLRDCGRLAVHIGFCQLIVLAVCEAAIAHPVYLWVLMQVFGDLFGHFHSAAPYVVPVFRCPVKSKALKATAQPHVTQRHYATATDESSITQGWYIPRRVRGSGSLNCGKRGLSFQEFSGVDNNTADTGAVPTHVLCKRMHNDVGAMLKRATQHGCGYGVIDDQWHIIFVGYISQGFLGRQYCPPGCRWTHKTAPGFVIKFDSSAARSSPKPFLLQYPWLAWCGQTGCGCHHKAD